MATRGINNFTPGIDDIIYGNEKEGIESAASKMEKGRLAVDALRAYKDAKKRAMRA